jgi:hypothetical protein
VPELCCFEVTILKKPEIENEKERQSVYDEERGARKSEKMATARKFNNGQSWKMSKRERNKSR